MQLIKYLTGVVIFTLSLQPAQALNLPTVTGPDVVTGLQVSAEPRAKGLVVVFLSAKCPCSQSHTPELAELARKYEEFQFVGVHSNGDESAELAKKYFSSLKLPFPVIQDSSAQIADRFKALKTPHVFVFAPGATVPVFQGGMSDSKDCSKADRHYLNEALADLESGKAPREKSVRTLGCTISRRKSG